MDNGKMSLKNASALVQPLEIIVKMIECSKLEQDPEECKLIGSNIQEFDFDYLKILYNFLFVINDRMQII
ncbi:hypothetical protein BpHYR1_036729 [Brachionus plicatilis]|uniref:Uncharacterized protein n=1 Tax=Brachionus plicatilis TaxID=10195 RepID=A0A3M7RKX9_BRAPC|nr:hypothetical protein BpHYR1_036729 [Brachionus plicatilis]